MTEHNRRTLMKAAGASLLGLTVSGTASGTEPANVGVPLLEARLSFDVGDAENLDWNHSDRPSKYAINPERGTLEVRSSSDEEAEALAIGDRLVNFHGIESNVDSIGGESVNSLFRGDTTDRTLSSYLYSPEGYDMPMLDINWDARTLPQLLASDQIEDVDVQDDLMRLRLPRQAITVRKKIVRDELVEDDSLPKWKRSKVVERPEVSVTVDAYLTAAFHPDLEIVRTN